MAKVLKREVDPKNRKVAKSESPAPKLTAAAVGKESYTSKGRRKHSPASRPRWPWRRLRAKIRWPWRLSNTLDTGFCVDALQKALVQGRPQVFNTDQSLPQPFTESNCGLAFLPTFPLDSIVTLFCPSIDVFLCLH